MQSHKLTSAATGKAHTLFVAADGVLLACGASKRGCVGPNAGKKTEFEATPLEAEDIAEAIRYALTAPPRATVNEVMVMPTNQRM